MRKVAVINNVSLDGVMQAPGHPDEDRRGGFDRGGWAVAYQDHVAGQMMGQGMAGGGALLLGRFTYEDLYQSWHGKTDNPFTEVLDNMQKYVASTTLTEPLVWQNSTLLKGDAAEAVAELKETPGPDLLIMGSGVLIQSLRGRGLIDEYLLLIHPLVIGKGLRLFPDGAPADLRVVESVTTTTGVLIGRYEPA